MSMNQMLPMLPIGPSGAAIGRLFAAFQGAECNVQTSARRNAAWSLLSNVLSAMSKPQRS